MSKINGTVVAIWLFVIAAVIASCSNQADLGDQPVSAASSDVWRNEKFDGHVYAVRWNGSTGIYHSPNCPCEGEKNK